MSEEKKDFIDENQSGVFKQPPFAYAAEEDDGMGFYRPAPADAPPDRPPPPETGMDAFFAKIINGFANIPKKFSSMTRRDWLKWLFKLISFVCGAVVLLIALGSLFSPVIKVFFSRNVSESVTPIDFISSVFAEDLAFNQLDVLNVSFWVYKIFFIIFAAVLGVAAAAFIFGCVSKREDGFAKKLSVIMLSSVVIMMFLSVLAGYNYSSIYLTMDPSLDISARNFTSFAFAFIFLIISLITGMTKRKENVFERSEKSIAMPFVLITLIISALFVPLYIFHNTRFKLNGYGLLSGAEDGLDFLAMTPHYKSLFIFFTVIASISFAVCVLMYLLKAGFYVRYKKFNTFLGITILIVYAMMGVNYMLVYIDAQGFQELLALSMNTYSYIPLALFICFLIGDLFVSLAVSKLKVEYKIYASGEGKLMDGKRGAPLAAGAPAGTVGDAFLADPIPAFSEIDRRRPEYEEDYRLRTENEFGGLTLPKLVNHVIEYAMCCKEQLSYGPVEIKSFVAGLAASRLSILQGMSGTGKTSLPRVFMEATSGLCKIIAVESSWRDKNELLGYYNEFNKKYTPKEFTQFLYRATFTPDIPVFIVLDELNLSRIEYYFSDFLSLMEAREGERSIRLFDVQLYPDVDERTEYLHLFHGHTIDIPPNVWFIGTANRDESTFEISDKVYDRAQTINFDKRAPKINETREMRYPERFVPYSVLNALFEDAKRTEFNAEACQPLRQVEKALRPYKISFGNRILKQIEDFVKVYVACSQIRKASDRSKYIAEAVDCIVLSKIVKKLEFKQIDDIDTLIEEFSSINLPRCQEFLASLQPMGA